MDLVSVLIYFDFTYVTQKENIFLNDINILIQMSGKNAPQFSCKCL